MGIVKSRIGSICRHDVVQTGGTHCLSMGPGMALAITKRFTPHSGHGETVSKTT